MTEQEIEEALIQKLGDLKYSYRPDIHDRAALEANFRHHFEALNHVSLSDSEFARVTTRMIGKTAKKMFITEGVTYSDE